MQDPITGKDVWVYPLLKKYKKRFGSLSVLLFMVSDFVHGKKLQASTSTVCRLTSFFTWNFIITFGNFFWKSLEGVYTLSYFKVPHFLFKVDDFLAKVANFLFKVANFLIQTR